MPRARRGRNASKSKSNDEIKRDPHEILHNLIQKARNLTDKDIWNHSLGGKQRNQRKIRATEKEEDEELMHEADLCSTRYFHLDKQPSIIVNGTLRDYQLEGVSWLINLAHNGLHGILADQMGLGKTLQTITLLAYLHQSESVDGLHLVVVPKSTIINWCREFAKWCPTLRVFALEANTKEERLAMIKQHFKNKSARQVVADTGNVIICSYEICMIEHAVLRRLDYEYIIVDEAHRLKNNASKFSRTLRTEFRSNHRLLITGTPLQNNLRELWSLLNFLLPDLFSSADDFESMFDFGNSEDEQAKIFQQLRTLLKPFLLRRLKVNVTKDLPPKTELILFVGMTALQKDVYKKLLLKEMNLIQSACDVDKVSKTSLLNLVMQLRKCTNHPYLFDGVEDMSLDPFGEHLIANCGKLLLLDKLLAKLKLAGSRVLIFSQMTRILDILEDYCAIRQHNYCRIDGSTSGEDRQTAMDEFNAPESELFVFLLTTRAGGLGINLQTADIVIIYDSDWNPQMDLQAMDRAHRIGQTKPVFVYRLVTKDTVEQRILERAELKLRLDAMVIQKHNKNGAAAAGGGQTRSDALLGMIQYGADKIFDNQSSTITDDDIDKILSASQSDTAKLQAEWHDSTKKQFNELSLEFNYQQYEGQDYTQKRKEKQARLNEERFNLLAKMNDEMQDGKTGAVRSTRLATQLGPAGSRRKNYNENAYFREKLNAARNHVVTTTDNSNALTPPARLPDIRYWQLYDVKRLYELNAKEWQCFNDWKNSASYDAELHVALTESEQALKKTLLAQGFDRIRYRDFGAFVRAAIKHGKDDADAIVASVMKDMDIGGGGGGGGDEDGGDTAADDGDDGEGDGDAKVDNEDGDDEVEEEETKKMLHRYHTAFFEKASDVEELQNALERIEEGEKRRVLRLEREKERDEKKQQRLEKKEQYLQRKKEAEEKRQQKRLLLEQKQLEQDEKFKAELHLRMKKFEKFIIENNDNVYKELQIPDARCADVGFSKDLDRYLFLLTYKFGYGEWQQIYACLLSHPYFQFNFFLQTLKPSHIKYRMDTILRACISSNKSKTGSKKRAAATSSREPSLTAKVKEIRIENGDTSNSKNVKSPPRKKRKTNSK